ncbi:hypothetical protein JKL49_03125 [Phenylobacterium sp. 20VBR1]|uniref:Uncharacterized protein n=1 Tax=Phenylobacterium glaciei TaxID=2803784 RepID=A0A941CX85_9CAUL|nr:DUF6491 family protein [Phenylobacterium glaciei]MBR7618370.1 hypothetical protein [Phenylobacterium glaciei]
MTPHALLLATAALIALAAGPAGAAPAAKPAKACFSARNVSNYAVVDDRTLNIRVGGRDVYQLDLMGVCPDLPSQNRIAIKSRGASFICSPLDATIIAGGPFGRTERCEVRGLRKLTPEEIAALPSRDRP